MEKSLQRESQDCFSQGSFTVPYKTEDRDCENAAEGTENYTQDTGESPANLYSNQPLMSKIPTKSSEETENCAQNAGEAPDNVYSNHPLMSEIPIKSSEGTENYAQNKGEAPANLYSNQHLMSENPTKSSEGTEIYAQNKGEAPANFYSNQHLMSENPIKSSEVDKPSKYQRFKNFFWPSDDTSLPQKTTKATGAVVTLEDLTKSVPTQTIRLKLKNAAKDKKPCEPQLMFGVEVCVDGMFRKAEADFQIEQKPEEETLARNVKRLRAIFDSIEQRIRQMAEEVKIKFSSLTLEQQEEFLVFWKAAEEMLGIVLGWLCEVFYVVLAKIREGYVIEKDVLKGVFKMGAAMLKDLYFEPMKKFIE